MIKRILIIIFLTAFSINAVEREYTKFSLFGGINANVNFHSATFENLPGYESCCTEFNNGLGIGYGIFAGAEYSILDKLNYRFSLSYSNLSAVLNEEEAIGYDITDNEYSEILVDFSYDNTLPYLITGHYANYRISDDMPINIFGGFQVGFPLSPQTDYKEELLSPENRVFETGSEFRNEQAGEINDISTVYFGLTAGVGYEVFSFSHFKIIPEISFTYALTDVVNSVDWRVNPLNAGVMFKYDIPVAKPEPIKPKDPPRPLLPEYPETPEEPFIIVDLQAKLNGNPINDGEKYIQSVNKINTVEVSNIVGIIFDIDEDHIHTIAKSLRQNNINEIKLKSYGVNSEESKNLVENVSKIIDEHNVNVSNYEVIYSDTSNLRYPELKRESERIEIFVKGNVYSNVLYDTISTIYEEPDLILSVEKNIESNYEIEREEGKLFINGKMFNSFGNNLSIDIAEKIDSFGNDVQNNIRVNYAANTKEINNEKELEFNIETKIVEKEAIYNYSDNKENKDRLILAYCKFDRSESYTVNKDILEKASKYLSSNANASITLIASTDDLGTEEYNEDLAIKRAKAVMNLFDKNLHNRINIESADKALYDNSTPLGRTKNRSVSVIFN